jgi:hypothetical protein
VRRLTSITLLLLFSFPLIAPLFALGGSAESDLPACCRRNGAHHCMMSAEQVAELEHTAYVTVVHSRCPLYPVPGAPVHHEVLALHADQLFYAGVLSHPAQFQQVEAWARVALDGARHKRGPPALRLS